MEAVRRDAPSGACVCASPSLVSAARNARRTARPAHDRLTARSAPLAASPLRPLCLPSRSRSACRSQRSPHRRCVRCACRPAHDRLPARSARRVAVASAVLAAPLTIGSPLAALAASPLRPLCLPSRSRSDHTARLRSPRCRCVRCACCLSLTGCFAARSAHVRPAASAVGPSRVLHVVCVCAGAECACVHRRVRVRMHRRVVRRCARGTRSSAHVRSRLSLCRADVLTVCATPLCFPCPPALSSALGCLPSGYHCEKSADREVPGYRCGDLDLSTPAHLCRLPCCGSRAQTLLAASSNVSASVLV